ncbi:MAG: ATP-binding cassette domain-containing protein [Synergistaceae bacterium]|nr:ATP-binding cassette domain-containing protein [Synergistaceae bacterium]
MPIIVKQLSYSYNIGLPTEQRALSEISFEAAEGEIISILGHTGSGKSTLAQHLNGLIIPQSGSVTVDGLQSGAASARQIRKKVGLVFQYPEEQIFAENVEEEIAFAPRNWGVEETEIKKRVKTAAATVGLDEKLLSASPFNLSGGQKRKVAIASVISALPTYLVLDEPTAGLDSGAAAELTSTLKKFASQGMGIIHITHDIELALSISTKILLLEQGRAVSWKNARETAELLALQKIRGLVTPEILELSRRLKEAGKIKKILWDAEELLKEIKNASLR